jgi:hypothetical protein
MKKLLFLLLVILSFATNAQVWTQKVNFAGTAAWGAVSFSIGNKGYMGTGETSTGYSQEFWEYDPFIDTWTQKANFGGGWRGRAVAFAIGNKVMLAPDNMQDHWLISGRMILFQIPGLKKQILEGAKELCCWFCNRQ